MNEGNLRKILARQPKKWIVNLVFVAAMGASLVWSFQKATFNEQRFATFGISLRVMIEQFGQINWNFFFGTDPWAFTNGVVYLALQTLAVAFLGTLLGAILALPFGFLASRTIVGKAGAMVGNFLLTVIRVFPEVILAIMIVKGYGINSLSCLLAIGVHSVGMLGKLFSEIIDTMDMTPLEALDAVGATRAQKVRFAILPNLLADFSSAALYRLDINVRSASVIGVVGAGGLGSVMLLAMYNWNWSTLGAILLAVIVMVVAVDSVSGFLRNKLV